MCRLVGTGKGCVTLLHDAATHASAEGRRGARPTASSFSATASQLPHAMIAARLTALATDQSDQKTKIERYKALLAELLPTADAPSIKAFAEHVTAEDCALVISRQVLMDLAAGLPSLPVEPLKEIGTYVLERMQPRVTSFEEQISMIREHLADVYEREEEWTEAAKMLAGIPLDSGIRVLEDNYKVEVHPDRDALSAGRRVGQRGDLPQPRVRTHQRGHIRGPEAAA